MNFSISSKKFNLSVGTPSGAVRPAGGGKKAASGTGFDVTKSDRTRRALNLIAGLVASADFHLRKQTLGQLREICRRHDRQASLFSGILDRAQDNIFGSNFDFIPNTGDKDLNKRAKDFITPKMEKEYCDATGERDFEDMCKTTLRAIWNDGDNLWVKRPDGSALIFEADQIETPNNKRNKNIVLGVELNDLNRHVAYHVKQRAKTGDYGLGRVPTDSTRISKSNAIFPAFRKRIGQTRGVPFLAASLGYYTRFNSYLEFESLAAEGNAMMGYKLTKPEPDENDMPGVKDNEDTTTNDTFEKLQKLEPFMIFELLKGEDIEMFSSQRPGENFEPYIITSLRIIGVGIGYPLEMILLDFSRTNYSSARASLGEARRMFRGWQKFSQKNIAVPWYRWQISRGIASGALPARPELFRTRCQWPAWDYIDPKKEAEGNAIAISTGTKTRSQCIRETGREPDEVFDEIKEDNDKLAERGIILPSANLKVIAGGTDEKDQDEKEDEEQK